VLRGGAFNNNRRNVRCAYRNRNNPNNFNRNNGFRVVVAHDFLILPEMPGGAGFPAEAPKKTGAARSWPHSGPHPAPIPLPLPTLRLRSGQALGEGGGARRAGEGGGQGRANRGGPAPWVPSLGRAVIPIPLTFNRTVLPSSALSGTLASSVEPSVTREAMGWPVTDQSGAIGD